jgi:hypothetical protein
VTCVVELSPSAARELRKFDPDARRRIQAAIELLAEQPPPPAATQLVGGGRGLVRARSARRLTLGDSGTGKSHLPIGSGVAACEAGRRVRYVTAAALVNELVEVADERVVSRVIARCGRFDLLSLDELGYLSLATRGAELLFQVLTEREERASVAVASNSPFGEWGKTFTDARLAGAVVDRLTFRALIIETGTEPFRLANTTTRGGRGACRLRCRQQRTDASRALDLTFRTCGAPFTSPSHW